MNFAQWLKDVFVSKFWIKDICFLLAVFVVVVINI